MQAASRGQTLATRKVVQASSIREIHIPAFLRQTPKQPQVPQIQRAFDNSRNFLTRFARHLVAPSKLRAPGLGDVGRALHTGASSATRPQTIANRLSFPVRTALARPFNAPHLPRPPIIPRSVAQVGLGTARNFSSARPIFDNLVQNVPVLVRAISNADIDLRTREKVQVRRLKSRSSQGVKQKKEITKMIAKKSSAFSKISSSDYAAEHARYFPTNLRSVTAVLTIPLAPTPSARFSMSLDGPVETRLPLASVLATHITHEAHSIRVSTLFTRLDAARVWERGAEVSAYTSPGAKDMCTLLKVTFVGWSAAAVRGVIGESGSGWCVLEEQSGHDDDDDDDAFSDILSEMSGAVDDSVEAVNSAMDPSHSMVLPRLDFSASFSSGPSSPSRSMSFESISDAEQEDTLGAVPNASWVGFSSDFIQRAVTSEVH